LIRREYQRSVSLSRCLRLSVLVMQPSTIRPDRGFGCQKYFPLMTMNTREHFVKQQLTYQHNVKSNDTKLRVYI